MKRINDIQGNEIEQIDIDVMLNLYIEEFKDKKKRNQKMMTKLFVKQFQEQEGIFSFDEVRTICKSV